MKGVLSMSKTNKFQRPKGTADILPGEIETWQKIEETARDVFRVYGYEGIRTPMFENLELFDRSAGETSDIVEKQMYDFDDKGGRHIALRPEGTAGVARAYVENRLYGPEYTKPYKVYYMGPMFRYERPQSGRQRQFTQIGCEALNNESPQVDVETIAMAMEFFKRLGVADKLKVTLNCLGDKETRDAYRTQLIDYLKPFYDQLSDDSKRRLYRNPLRVLDSKDTTDKKIVANAPSILDCLSDYSQKYFDTVKQQLDALGIKYEIDPDMVRGLDYYNQTIFEIMSDSPVFGGDWVTVCGGGRYNGLIAQVGGPDNGGIGFGIGVERLLLLLQEENPDFAPQPGLDLFFTAPDKDGSNYAFKLMIKLRSKDVAVDKDYEGRKLGTQIKEAARRNAKYFTVIGDREIESGQLTLKHTQTGEQVEVAVDDLLANPQNYLK